MNIGDKVRILASNDYDDGDTSGVFGEFAGLTGTIVRTGYEVPVPQALYPCITYSSTRTMVGFRKTTRGLSTQLR